MARWRRWLFFLRWNFAVRSIFRDFGRLIRLTVPGCVGAALIPARTLSARFLCGGQLRVERAQRLHALERFAEHRLGFGDSNWTIDQEIDPVIAHFRGCGFVVDD